MTNDARQQLKEKLLESLIEEMSMKDGDRLKPHGMAVEVAAPSKDKLVEGLDHAKGALGSMADMHEGDESDSEEEDEQKLLDLLAREDDEDEDDKNGLG